MKKFISILTAFALVFALLSLPVSADEIIGGADEPTSILISTVTAAASDVSVTLDGEVVDCVDANGNSVSPLLIDGTTYLPVRAIATALGVEIEWDGDTQSVFINGVTDAELGETINIYINGSKFTAKNVNGDVVDPILLDGTTYLPIRAIGEAFDKNVSWDNENRTAVLTTPAFVTSFDENKTYAIISAATGKAISVTDSGLVTEEYNSYDYQAFKFVETSVSGYYNIQSVTNEKNFDVNGNSTAAGAKIITYTPGTANNQMFAAVEDGDYVIIYARSSKLPIEDSAGMIKQNVSRDSIVQRWLIVETTPTAKVETQYYLSSGSSYLTGGDSLTVSASDSSDAQKWVLSSDEYGQYIITNVSTEKSLDVANNSTTAGDPIITYATSGDPNQCWMLQKNDDGTYLIQSVHSSLYLAIDGDSIVHSETGTHWTITKAN
ncbi:MAG: RICIN domain-containing protein [Clostridia bacterium]|nr:RICIN domain-containing protein [Clostridia bacterium]